MRMNSNIILAGQPVNAMANFAQGIQSAGMANQIGDNNRLRDVFSTQGAGILAGDQGALDALATAGPQGGQMALGVRQQQQEMEIQRERLSMARQAAAQQAAQFAAGLGEVERQRVVQALSTQAPRAVRAAQQGDVAGFNAIVDPYREVLGFGPAQDEQEMLLQLAAISGMSEGFAGVVEAGGIGQSQGFRPATPEEAARYGAVAGQFGPDGRFYPNNPPDSLSFSTTPDGGVSFSSGPNVTMPGVAPTQPGLGAGAADVTDPSQFAGAVLDIGTTPQGFATGLDNAGALIQRAVPGGPEDPVDEGNAYLAQTQLDTIDRVLNSPSLEAVTGNDLGGRVGGSIFRPQDQQDLLVDIDQIEGSAFMAAFESLRGAGEITENESAAAQAAIARLNRTQSTPAYRAALTELRNLLEIGRRRFAGENVPEFGGAPDAFGGSAQIDRPETMPEAVFNALPQDPESRAYAIRLWNNMTPAQRREALNGASR